MGSSRLNRVSNLLSVALPALVLGFQLQSAAQPSPEYRVGPRDVLNISVFEEAELTGRYTVDNDGTFTFPLVGRVTAGGRTLRQIETTLTRLLADGYLKKPQVSIEVESYRSQSVFIMGEVRSPNKYPLSGNMTLIEALAAAGSVTNNASNVVLVIHPRRAVAGPVLPSEAGDAQVQRVNIKDLQAGKLTENVVIRDGDTIYVPKAETIFITGQVRTPGSYVAEPGISVLQALSLAGGIADRGSDRRIKIIRLVNGKKQEISAKLSDPVMPGDTIVVPQRFF
jgi:polysaccharide export outer membrane protein